jgi:hypothetical protein
LGILNEIAKNLTAVFASFIELRPIICPGFLFLTTIVGAFFFAVRKIPFTLLLSSGNIIGVLLVGLLLRGLLVGRRFDKRCSQTKNWEQEIQELTNLLCLGPQIAADQVSSEEDTGQNPRLNAGGNHRIGDCEAGKGTSGESAETCTNRFHENGNDTFHERSLSDVHEIPQLDRIR